MSKRLILVISLCAIVIALSVVGAVTSITWPHNLQWSGNIYVSLAVCDQNGNLIVANQSVDISGAILSNNTYVNTYNLTNVGNVAVNVAIQGTWTGPVGIASWTMSGSSVPLPLMLDVGNSAVIGLTLSNLSVSGSYSFSFAVSQIVT